MFRKTTYLLTLVSLIIAFAFLAGGSAGAAPLAQSTATPEHDMNMNSGDEHNENGMDMDHAHDEDMEMSGERLDPGDASIRIVAPADGAMFLGSSLTVKVETVNFVLGEEGNHFHLYVDGKEQGMSQGNSETIAANDLEPGEHTIEVVLTNGLHQELDAVASITVHAGAEGAVEAAPTGDNSLVTVAGIVGAVIVLAGAGFFIARRQQVNN